MENRYEVLIRQFAGEQPWTWGCCDTQRESRREARHLYADWAEVGFASQPLRITIKDRKNGDIILEVGR